MLTDDQKQALLDLARRSVWVQVTGRTQPPESAPRDLPDASGVFVTLTRDGELRGCLGTLQCNLGLAGEVMRCAADAACEDPRFPPVAGDELGELSLEISVLGPLERVDPSVPGAVVVGRHGLVVEQGPARGLLLPQVASERDWTPEQFLAQTCIKAGLHADAWRHRAEVYRFEAQVFGPRSLAPLEPLESSNP
jgi:AmmeMemoRadiSam system protein A